MQPIDVAEHHEVLKFATAPELRCPTCKAAMQCTASEAAMTVLPGLPKPTATEDLVKSIGMLRERALAPLRRDQQADAAGPRVRRRSPSRRARSGLPSMLACAARDRGRHRRLPRVPARHRARSGPQRRSARVASKSATARPAWIMATPGGVTCTEPGTGCRASDSSALVGEPQDDAEDEASDAAPMR